MPPALSLDSVRRTVESIDRLVDRNPKGATAPSRIAVVPVHPGAAVTLVLRAALAERPWLSVGWIAPPRITRAYPKRPENIRHAAPRPESVAQLIASGPDLLVVDGLHDTEDDGLAEMIVDTPCPILLLVDPLLRAHAQHALPH